jgi:VCBS repeat-containing protein
MGYVDADLGDELIVSVRLAVLLDEQAQPVVVADEVAAALVAALQASLAPDSTAGEAVRGTLNWAFAPEASALAFVADGRTVTARFDLTVTDRWGGAFTQPVDIAIVGDNQQSAFGGDLSLVMASSDRVATGRATVVDPDLNEARFVEQTVDGLLGQIAVQADGSWRYVMRADANVAPGAALFERFVLDTADQGGEGATPVITITVRGPDLSLSPAGSDASGSTVGSGRSGSADPAADLRTAGLAPLSTGSTAAAQSTGSPVLSAAAPGSLADNGRSDGTPLGVSAGPVSTVRAIDLSLGASLFMTPPALQLNPSLGSPIESPRVSGNTSGQIRTADLQGTTTASTPAAAPSAAPATPTAAPAAAPAPASPSPASPAAPSSALPDAVTTAMSPAAVIEAHVTAAGDQAEADVIGVETSAAVSGADGRAMEARTVPGLDESAPVEASVDAGDVALAAAGAGVVLSSLSRSGRIHWEQTNRSARRGGAIRW